MLHQSIKAILEINFKMKTTLVFLLIAITYTLAAPCNSKDKHEQYNIILGLRNGQWDTNIPEYPSKSEIVSTNGWSRDGFYSPGSGGMNNLKNAS